MKCIILAAGASTRMRDVAGNIPKCLLEVGGKPLLQRTIENVLEVGIREIGLVLGFRKELVRAFVKRRFPHEQIKFVMNPKFESTNNAFSLLLAREFYRREAHRGAPLQPLLLLDSDLLFGPTLLPELLSDDASDKLAVRVQGDHDDEEVLVTVDADRHVVTIGKTAQPASAYGESIGIEAFSPRWADSLFDVLERRVRHGTGRTEFYEASFQELIDRGMRMRAVDITTHPAAEIDTPEDLQFAQERLLPEIDAGLLRSP